MGGEKRTLQRSSVSGSGSPPRGRGKVPPCQFGYIWLGITPAWAGKRYGCNRSTQSQEDHPRVGGEKGPRPGQVGRQPGSPPRGRGKAPLPRRSPYVVGITPAWAGKSQVVIGQKSNFGDHPRVGGEKIPVLYSLLKNPGITPAWAGKRAKETKNWKEAGDHPRVGGEKCQSRFFWLSSRGSPPRGRGKD